MTNSIITILIIDDDTAILESLQYLLEDAGYHVITAVDSRNLTDLLAKIMPQLILLDYRLPEKNGGDIAKELKSQTATHHIPIIIISASLNLQMLLAQTGADDYIAKPYDMNDLLTKIDKNLHKVN